MPEDCHWRWYVVEVVDTFCKLSTVTSTKHLLCLTWQWQNSCGKCVLSRAAHSGHSQEGIKEVGPGIWFLGAAPDWWEGALLHSVPPGFYKQPGLWVDLSGLVTGYRCCKETTDFNAHLSRQYCIFPPPAMSKWWEELTTSRQESLFGEKKLNDVVDSAVLLPYKYTLCDVRTISVLFKAL